MKEGPRRGTGGRRGVHQDARDLGSRPNTFTRIDPPGKSRNTERKRPGPQAVHEWPHARVFVRPHGAPISRTHHSQVPARSLSVKKASRLHLAGRCTGLGFYRNSGSLRPNQAMNSFAERGVRPPFDFQQHPADWGTTSPIFHLVHQVIRISCRAKSKIHRTRFLFLPLPDDQPLLSPVVSNTHSTPPTPSPPD